MFRKLIAFACVTGSVFLPTLAAADETPGQDSPPEANASQNTDQKQSMSFGVLGGYGAGGFAVGSESVNPYGIGFGVRGGYNVAKGVYTGIAFMYHLGSSTDIDMGPAGKYTYTQKIMYPGVEGGYELPAGPLTLRPYVGVGYAMFKNSWKIESAAGSSEASANANQIAFWPGAVAMVDLGPAFVGLDARYLISSGINAFAGFGTAGAKF